MSRLLALTSAAALCLFCAACNGGDEDDDTPQGQLKDTRSNVTGTHPVMMTMRIPGVPEEPEPFATTLTLTEEASSRDGLRISFLLFDCDLTGTMTGESTFKVNPGTCVFSFPAEGVEDACAVTLDLNGGSGGRDSAQAKVNATFNGIYTLGCEGEGMPITTPVTVEVVGS
ncbi:hypothetical protein [Corallococcus llansteffanensis]|uniref:Lipoprotein n=1 Tax=Corallococcus llansteffanensis TaxID=2316731 RepID=A0A3A8Q407_9BACT|nr:hypothetical protein [Corallococcus llansteffanensis]RKH63403.1 hypothetical protein D7V93_08800 [Corallococcus llansteffanensis]